MTLRLSSLKQRNKYKERLSPPQVGIVTFIGDEIFPVTFNQPFFEYFSGCAGPDGNIYGFPWNDRSILKIDPNVGTATTINMNPLTGYGSTFDSYTCSGSTLHPNGKIYTISLGLFSTDDTKVFEYDPIANKINSIDTNGSFDCRSLCLHPNGKIYAAPFTYNKVLEIDPIAGISTTETFGIVAPTTNANWAGMVLGPNNKIYAIPFNATSVLEIDPSVGTATTFGSFTTGGSKWWGGILAPNGKIYGIPSDSTTILEIDPINKTTSTFGDTSGESIFNGFLGHDGNVYFLVLDSQNILKLDLETKTISTYHTFSEIQSIGVGILAENGSVYCPPCGRITSGSGSATNRVLKITLGTAAKPNPYIISPHQNRF